MKPSGPVLVCAATARELAAIGTQDMETLEPDLLWRIPEGYAAVTGVGIPATLMRLLPWLDALRPGWLVNVGIAGAYPGGALAVGDLVLGLSECFADLGVETPDAEVFLPLADLPFAEDRHRKPLELWIPEGIEQGGSGSTPRRARGATVNCCAGKNATGELRRRLFQADFESMEGAAVALAGVGRGLPVFEVRAISNIAGDRDMRPVNIALALDALRTFWESRRRLLA